MTLPTHILLGSIIGQLTGNLVLAIAVSVLVDIDHLYSYIKSKVIFSPRKFWKTVTDKNDPYGDQRGYLHNVIVAGIISVIVWLALPLVGLTFALAYFGHLLLDALDKSDYWPLFPNKKINITGFVGYFSPGEVMIDVGLVVLLIILI